MHPCQSTPTENLFQKPFAPRLGGEEKPGFSKKPGFSSLPALA
jgi:hypothetical protein